ncbi:hypothetical protein IWX90DRAFT_411163 [Phyllosticta citrichinensis]|uniref:Uncharacterized protein n=1 Tax=Phyllosticta citrichinensis TaxID=1130410 RepID=A0ABR1Y7J9_9PEZI
MKLTTIPAALLSLATLSASAPTTSPDTSFNPRAAPLGLYICKGPFWNGPCSFHPERFSLCNNAPAGWNNQISSFGPPRNYYCTLYENWNCKGRSISLTYPGSSNLARNGFNNIGSSWRCSPANAKGVLLGGRAAEAEAEPEADAEAEADPEWDEDVVGVPVEAEAATA